MIFDLNGRCNINIDVLFESDSSHSFLDDFSREMDQRMEEMNNRIGRMENALSLVEFKLNSVPEAKTQDTGAGSDPS